MSRTIYVNLPVADPAASRDFFAGLGFEFDPRFAGEHGFGMRVNDHAYVMLVSREFCAGMSPKPLADAHATCEVEIGVSADSREMVDTVVDGAVAAGGAPAGPVQDHEGMYGRSFLDLDGHQWEIMWMDA